MADLKEKKNQALQELKRLQEADKPQESALHLSEPELETFDASHVFEVEKETQPEDNRPFRLGKHSRKRASRVKVKKEEYENKHVQIEDLPMPGKHALEQEKPEQPVEEPTETPVEEPAGQPVEEPAQEEEVQQAQQEQQPQEEPTEKESQDVVENDDDDDIQVEFLEEESAEEEGPESADRTDGSQDGQENEETVEEAGQETEEEESIDYSDEDLFYEKRNFLLSQYDQEVKYLEEQSQRGYHFVKKEGKNFAFVQGEPKDYYYTIVYCTQEPTKEEKDIWKKAGWKIITTNPGNKKDAGWVVLRNEEQPGQYRKVIENEEEKYQFFRRYASSCRSTLFLIFVCMACCVVTAFLQFSFKGHPIGIAICALLFVIALIAFISYNRMLKEAKRMASLLKARLRLRAREDSVMGGYEESDAELDSDWNELGKEKD